ncbi:MAG: hypothetical protein N2Z60_09760, partial [Elusimicrobiales bacterium]|nr:hypothetical protein [Elusimicrobiales bacterium]
LIIFRDIYEVKKRKNDLNSFANSFNFEFYEDGSILENLYYLNNFNKLGSNLDDYRQISYYDIFALEKIDLSFTGLPIFNEGYSKKATNLIMVPYDKSTIYFFDYLYKVGGGRYSKLYRYTIALYKSKNIYPSLFMRPENFVDKLTEFIGLNDIDISNYPKFSKKYYLKSTDVNFVTSFLNSEVISFFENSSGWHLEISGNYLAIYRGSGMVEIYDYNFFINDVKNILSLLKIE